MPKILAFIEENFKGSGFLLQKSLKFGVLYDDNKNLGSVIKESAELLRAKTRKLLR